MSYSAGLLPSTFAKAVQDAIGSLALPGLTPVESVVLMYMLLWLLPFLVCIRHVGVELRSGLMQRYREGGLLWLFAGLLSVAALLAAAGLYGLSAVSFLHWGNLASEAELPYASIIVEALTKLWADLVPVGNILQLAPTAVLACALGLQLLAEMARWLSAHSVRAARTRRTRAVLSQLEAQLTHPAERRGPIQYW